MMRSKRHSKKRALALIAALSLTVGVFAGCSAQEKAPSGGSPASSGAGQSSAGEEAAFTRDEKGIPDLKGTTFRIWFPLTEIQARFTTDMGEYAVIQKLGEMLNCKFEFMHPPVGQERDNFSVLLAGNDWPDMIFGAGIGNYPGGIGSAMADGVMYDVTPYIDETNTPNFMEKVINDESLKKWFMDDDSRVIRLGAKISGSAEADIDFFGPMMRKDYLEATGMEAPSTIDEWHEVLTKMKANGVQYPLALNATGWDIQKACNAFASAYGIGLSWYIAEDGKTVAYGPAQPAFKDYLATMNQWYSEGLVNPDYPNQTTDDTLNMLAAGQVGSIIAHLFDYNAKYFNVVEAQNPAAALVGIQYPLLKEGDKLSRFRPSSLNVNDEKTITTKAKDPLACIWLLDCLYMDEIDTMLQYGVEGVSYEVVDGKPIKKIITEDQPREIQLQDCPQQWHTTEDATMDGVLRKYCYGSDEQSIRLWGACTTDGNFPTAFVIYTTEEADTRSKYSTDLETFVTEMTLKFITGGEPLENFDQYVQQLNDTMHLQEMLAVQQSAYDRYIAR